ncbi:diguanylate cyclase domain-containing protein [Desulfurobacterium sp.]
MVNQFECELMKKINSGDGLSLSDYQKISVIAKEEIKFLVRNGIPLTPLNYYLWFDIFCYLHETGKDLSDPEIMGIFKEKYPDESVIETAILKINKADRKFIRQIAEEVTAEIEKVLRDIDNHNKIIENHAEKVEKTTEVLSDENLRAMLETVVKALNDIKLQNETLRKRLQESRKEIEKVSEKLDESEKNVLVEFLTEIASKKSFEKVLKDMFDDFESRNYPFAVLMVKLDKFEEIVKGEGEKAGKIVLQEVARKLKKLLRVNDVVAYYDDSIFGILLPGVTFGHAIRIGERIRKSIEDMLISINGKTLKVTVSVGAAVARKDMDETDLITKALEALELANKEGGNTIKTDLDVELEK